MSLPRKLLSTVLELLPHHEQAEAPFIALVVGNVTYVLKDRHGPSHVEIDTGTELRVRLQNNGIDPDIDTDVVCRD